MIILDEFLNEKIREATVFLIKLTMIYIGLYILLTLFFGFISDFIPYGYSFISQIYMILTGIFVGIGAGFGYTISKHMFEQKFR